VLNVPYLIKSCRNWSLTPPWRSTLTIQGTYFICILSTSMSYDNFLLRRSHKNGYSFMLTQVMTYCSRVCFRSLFRLCENECRNHTTVPDINCWAFTVKVGYCMLYFFNSTFSVIRSELMGQTHGTDLMLRICSGKGKFIIRWLFLLDVYKLYNTAHCTCISRSNNLKKPYSCKVLNLSLEMKQVIQIIFWIIVLPLSNYYYMCTILGLRMIT